MIYRFIISYTIDVEADSLDEARDLYTMIDDVAEAQNWSLNIVDEDGKALHSEASIQDIR